MDMILGSCSKIWLARTLNVLATSAKNGFDRAQSDNLWSRRVNDELAALHGKPIIQKMVKARMIWWTRHAARISDNNLANLALRVSWSWVLRWTWRWKIMQKTMHNGVILLIMSFYGIRCNGLINLYLNFVKTENAIFKLINLPAEKNQ